MSTRLLLEGFTLASPDDRVFFRIHHVFLDDIIVLTIEQTIRFTHCGCVEYESRESNDEIPFFGFGTLEEAFEQLNKQCENANTLYEGYAT